MPEDRSGGGPEASRNRVRWVVGAVGVVVLVSTLALSASTADTTHTNDLTAPPQVVADGEIVVDSAFSSREGYLVVHRVDGDSPGEPLSWVAIEDGSHDNLRVPVEGLEGTTEVWLVLHGDDGDREFEPGDDPPLYSFGEPAGARVPVAVGDSPVYLLSQSFGPVDSDGSVTVERVAVDRPAHVVVRAYDDGDPGRVVGTTRVGPGTTRNVSVALSGGFYADQEDSFRTVVTLHEADGDGTYDGEDPVTVGGDPVQSLLVATKGSSVGVVVATTTDTRATPEPTTTEGPDSDSGPAATTTPGSPATGDDTTSAPAATGDGGLAQPGLGGVLAVVSVVLALLALAVRRPR